MAYNPDVKAIIVFSNSGKSAKLVSAMSCCTRIISPNINISRQVSLLSAQSINSRDANWKDMMTITKEIIKKLNCKKTDLITGLPFGKAGMTNISAL